MFGSAGRRALVLCAGTTLWLSAAICAGQTAPNANSGSFPTKPLRMIVPFPAAGGADIFARLVSRKLEIGRAHV